MRTQYPQAMTSVLQHQFWDLTVGNDVFEVGLSFGGVSERVVVPFEAVTAFFDPAVQFGLQFESMESQAADEPGPRTKSRDAGAGQGRSTADAEPEPKADGASGGAEVVRLDRFRKK